MNHREDMNVACVASMCVHVHVHAQSLSHLAGMAMLQVWSLVGRWHSQCGVSGPKLDDLPLVCGAHKGAQVSMESGGAVA